MRSLTYEMQCLCYPPFSLYFYAIVKRMEMGVGEARRMKRKFGQVVTIHAQIFCLGRLVHLNQNKSKTKPN